MTQAQVPYAHEFQPGGTCGSDACTEANHVVCAVCGGGETAYNHLPEARGDVPTEGVAAGAAGTVPVQANEAASGGEATR